MSGCRLVNDITGGVDVEGGEAVHFTLDVRLPAVLLWHAFGNLGMDQAPVLTASSPFFANIYHGQIQHFQQAVIGRKHGFGFCHLAQLAVNTLNGVGGAD